jgi:hypothetical protein
MNASEWREVPGYGQRGVDILAELEAAEKANWDREKDVKFEFDRAEKAEADLVTANLETAKWHQAFGVAEAERDALKAELADYKEAWKEREFPKTSYEAERRWSEACARIRARREKEAGK